MAIAIERSELDGVPIYWAEGHVPFQMGLLFRVGRADETLAAGEFCCGSLAGEHVGIHAEFAHFAGNQVGVLSSGVEDGDLGLGNVVSHL